MQRNGCGPGNGKAREEGRSSWHSSEGKDRKLRQWKKAVREANNVVSPKRCSAGLREYTEEQKARRRRAERDIVRGSSKREKTDRNAGNPSAQA